MSKKADKKSANKKDKAEKKEKKSKRKGEKKGLSKLTAEERLERVATAAYYIAEGHGFTPGRAEKDWLKAERQIEKSLRKKHK